ncbi:c-type cytochrome [Calidithermus chliarophilus]|uniref:c-type cytochrome n=1 Tax=Calidithermus chliarophilus TaxID=52023 RepID=UPI000419F9C9|nr:c-type cytochrome [Calidithermus chliarophilus]
MRKGVRIKRLVVLGVVCSMLLPGATAYDPEELDVLVAQSPTYGAYLTDLKGRSLYLFTRDTKDTVTCYGTCAQNWPPLLFKDKAKPLAGQGVDEKLLGFTKRTDGAGSQITYNGWPLYYYARDQKPGDFGGQGVGGNWFLVSPKGEAIRQAAQATQPAQPAQPAPAQSEAMAKLMAEGEPLYTRYCAGCHGANGAGGVGPKLAGVPNLKDARFTIRQILGGGQQMPGFGGTLSDQEVAAVTTYIRNSWGNQFGVTTAEEVKANR